MGKPNKRPKPVKIDPKPGTIEHGSVACCAAYERCVVVTGDDTYKTGTILSAQGWRKSLGRWICGECAG